MTQLIAPQLDLWEEELSALPWRGVRPRVLTRGWRVLFLRREPQKDDCFFVDSDQSDMWATVKKGPPGSSRGAPLLLPLTGER